VDDDPAKAGRRVNGLEILPLAELPRVVKQEALQIGVIAVPGEAAQPVADQLVVAGIRAILNFAPARLKVPRDVRLQNVDLSIELENLSFHLAQTPR
jgi:redox-sensing transcriptional repressor